MEELERLKSPLVSRLLKRFWRSYHHGSYKAWREKRLRAHEYNSQWIRPESIRELSDEELSDRFENYYRGGEGRQSFNQVWRDRIIRNIGKFRETLLYLLDEEIPLRTRFDEVVERGGRHHIEGVGKGLASALLMDFNIEKYCLWNNKTIMGLGKLGELVGATLVAKRGTAGERYEKTLKVLRFLRDEVEPSLNLTYDDVDAFLHWISSEEEGIKAFNEVAGLDREELEIPSPEERYISRVLYENFDTILGEKFNLKLYTEDPDNEPVEYPTEVGRIDLLAVEKDTGNYVVIEIKRNPDPSVIGQIMKYMGWVKENLAGDKEVKGILLADNIGKKLRYALKMAGNIKPLLYRFSLTIEEPEI
ncbi:MAG: hypothetical protein DRJ67_03015 [Thermoprotei archaeon]|nr:MAG: hypothetical protein DRJ67_03015 [Thermoprotei archaeon]